MLFCGLESDFQVRSVTAFSDATSDRRLDSEFLPCSSRRFHILLNLTIAGHEASLTEVPSQNMYWPSTALLSTSPPFIHTLIPPLPSCTCNPKMHLTFQPALTQTFTLRKMREGRIGDIPRRVLTAPQYSAGRPDLHSPGLGNIR